MKKNKINIPKPSILRLCKIYNLLEEIEKSGEKSISSKIIECLRKYRINASPVYKNFYNRTLDRLENEPSLKQDILRFISIADKDIKDFDDIMLLVYTH